MLPIVSPLGVAEQGAELISLRQHTLDRSWLWCETWCSDESLATAKTIDLCNNPREYQQFFVKHENSLTRVLHSYARTEAATRQATDSRMDRLRRRGCCAGETCCGRRVVYQRLRQACRRPTAGCAAVGRARRVCGFGQGQGQCRERGKCWACQGRIIDDCIT